MRLSSLKDLFGKPNTGMHRYRIMNIAVVDVLATILLAMFLSRYVKAFGKAYWKRVVVWFLLLCLIGETLHYVLGVQTSVMKAL